MTYHDGFGGRMISDLSDAGRFLSYDEVEARLVEAMLICWRQPNRERGWLWVKSAMPEIVREVRLGDYDARGGDLVADDVQMRPASLTRADVAAMTEAFGWVEAVEGDDRRLIGLALAELARNEKRVPWKRLIKPMGYEGGSRGLAMRYRRAMMLVTRRANRTLAA